MISVEALEEIAAARLADGKALGQAGRFAAASYLCGYGLEIKLKARICRHLGWSDFPETTSEFQNYRSFQTHDLSVLLSLTGVEPSIKLKYASELAVMGTWSPTQRYQSEESLDRSTVKKQLRAVETLLKVL